MAAYYGAIWPNVKRPPSLEKVMRDLGILPGPKAASPDKVAESVMTAFGAPAHIRERLKK